MIAITKKTITGKYAVDGPPMVRVVSAVACSKSIYVFELLWNCERRDIKWPVRTKSIGFTLLGVMRERFYYLNTENPKKIICVSTPGLMFE